MSKLVARTLLSPGLLLAFMPGLAQTSSPIAEQVKEIQNSAQVKAANQYIDSNRDGILREWIAITEINAPSKQEHVREIFGKSPAQIQAAEYSLRLGGEPHRGAQRGGRRTSYGLAHMDTVFQPGLKIKAKNLNIGMLGGSEVVNAKAADAWFTVDLRSTSNEVIAEFEKKIAEILEEEAKRAGLSLKTEVISTSPAAVIPGHRDSQLVKIAEAVHRAMGFDPPITNTGSNNSSAALLAGIPSISTGAGPCSDSHALT
ncbi:MAG: hypothetical protein ABR556_01090, partial [Pyrinomonadaceae bacterium]